MSELQPWQLLLMVIVFVIGSTVAGTLLCLITVQIFLYY